MKKFFKFIGYFLLFILVFAIGLHVFAYFASLQPKKIQSEKVFKIREAPLLQKGQSLKVLSWNVQYMAGKNYVFFYDLLDGSGKDARPSSEDIAKTLQEVARIIEEEKPDIILLQEVDDGAKRTDYKDQLTLLLALLPKDYAFHTSAYYWQSAFVPHPRILGASGMKLSIISKYPIASAQRYQLPITPRYWLVQQFNLKRAILEASLPIENGDTLFVMNTHFSAFSQQTNTLAEQIAFTRKLLLKRTDEEKSWLIGGDFNLLATDKAYKNLGEYEKQYYQPQTELKPILDAYQAVPNIKEIDGEKAKDWFTHFPNNPAIKQPDRTIDYIFFANTLKITDHKVRQGDTWKISDHLPIIVTFKIPEK